MVTAYSLENIALAPANTVEAVLQNVAVLLSTRKGTSPLARDFGLPQDFLDKPLPLAKAICAKEVQEAIFEFEPRASVQSITFGTDENAPGKLIPTVEIEVNLDG